MFQFVLGVFLGSTLGFFQGCSRNVLRVSYGCCRDVSGCFQGFFMGGILGVMPGVSLGVSGGCYTGVSEVYEK